MLTETAMQAARSGGSEEEPVEYLETALEAEAGEETSRGLTQIYALDDESDSSDDGQGLLGQGSAGNSFSKAFEAMDKTRDYDDTGPTSVGHDS